MSTESSGKVALIAGITGQDGAYLARFLLAKGPMACHAALPNSKEDFKLSGIIIPKGGDSGSRWEFLNHVSRKSRVNTRAAAGQER
jgi:hypothetical protein